MLMPEITGKYWNKYTESMRDGLAMPRKSYPRKYSIGENQADKKRLRNSNEIDRDEPKDLVIKLVLCIVKHE